MTHLRFTAAESEQFGSSTGIVALLLLRKCASQSSVKLAAHFALSCKYDAASPQNKDSKDCVVNVQQSCISRTTQMGRSNEKQLLNILACFDSVSSFKIIMLTLSSLI
jgi:hypothetical protein